MASTFLSLVNHISSYEWSRFTSRQPMSSGAASSAGRAKKDWGRAGMSWEGVVAMGVAWVERWVEAIGRQKACKLK